ncbi:zeta toxin family protein [Arcicella sp. LKC2W]|uniref:zeta toxin family protein n=1 Tax=Arcicella sp. LKC2W TaxID=2984198 RepID=UPI002B21D877|nr:zeta toxin family protein [Arcicella sp. LKC2W]MEA5461628.1 zeta toxin family protein [Arcicella sp. LKC2W]
MNNEVVNTLKVKYPVGEEDYQKALNTIIVSETAGIYPSKNPVVTILGAQPGAGKTEIQRITQEAYQGNIVVCNADNLRAFYPRALELNRLHPKEFPLLTSDFAHRLKDGLQAHCLKHGFSFSLETTFKNPNDLNEMMDTYTKAGFQTDIKLLAVNRLISRLYTEKRYEDMYQLEGAGRNVPKQAHDEREKALTPTVEGVIKANKFRNMSLYKRAIVTSESSIRSGVSLLAENPPDALNTFKEEKNRPLTDQERYFYKNVAEQVLFQKQQRNATFVEIFAFKMEFNDLLTQKQQQIDKSLNKGIG